MGEDVKDTPSDNTHPTKTQAFNLWMARHAHWVWCRYWGSRLMATTYYSYQLDAKTPEIVGWLNFKRHALGVLIMLAPFRLPVRPQFAEIKSAEGSRP